MPYLNEHAARVRQRGRFQKETMRSKQIAKGLRIIIGKLKPRGASMVTQAYRFRKDVWTPAQARKWLREHQIQFIRFDPARKE